MEFVRNGRSWVLGAALALAGCSEGSQGGGDEDAAVPVDAAGEDASSDAGADAGPSDAGAIDGGLMDAGGENDTGVADAGTDANVPSDAGVPIDAGPQQAVTIRFRGVVGATPAACGASYPGFGASGEQTAKIRDFRFYVHGIELLDALGDATPVTITDDAPFQRAGVALVDLEDGTSDCTNGTTATHTDVTGTVPEGTYVGMRFVLGVPFDLNHRNRSTAAPPLDLSALFWNWQGGYIFSRLDLLTVPGADGGLPAGYSVHLGSTGCDGNPVTGGTTTCIAPNRPTVTFAAFDPSTNVVLADAYELAHGVDLAFNTPATALGCMSAPNDPECVPIMPRFGLDFGASPGAQSFFRLGTEP